MSRLIDNENNPQCQPSVHGWRESTGAASARGTLITTSSRRNLPVESIYLLS